jgi:Zn-dependent protease
MHGWTAERLGDPTARLAGRLTLNPLVHIDPVGTIFLPLILVMMNTGLLFGWAKPVPYNPFNLRDKRFGPALVAAAGPLTNLFIALVLGLFVRLATVSAFTGFLSIVVYVNVLLAIFNLVPLPPLDGSKILFSLLPDNKFWWQFKINIDRYGMILVFVFIFFFWNLISPVIGNVYRLIVGQTFF